MLLFGFTVFSLLLQLSFSLKAPSLSLKDVSTQSISIQWSFVDGDAEDFLATISPINEGESPYPENINASFASWSNLIPGKNYSIAVIAVRHDGEQSPPAVIDVTTKPMPAYYVRISKFVNPVLTEYSVNGNKTMMFPVYGAVVMWEGPDAGCYDDYNVDVNPPHGSVRIPVVLNAGKPVSQPLKKRRIIWDLIPGVEYKFTVRSKCNGKLSEPASASERMPSEIPSAIDITNLTPTSVSLSWDHPHRGILDGYIIEVAPPEGEVIEPLIATEKRRTIENLTPGSKYKIDVYSTSSEVLSFQSRTVHIKTPPLTPLGPVLASDITTSSVIIKWQWPGKNVDYYEVIFYPTKRDYGRLRHRIGDPEVQLNSLESDTEYSLILYSVANKVYSKPLYAKVRTASLIIAEKQTTAASFATKPATAPNDEPPQPLATTRPKEKTTSGIPNINQKDTTDFYKDEVTSVHLTTKSKALDNHPSSTTVPTTQTSPSTKFKGEGVFTVSDETTVAKRDPIASASTTSSLKLSSSKTPLPVEVVTEHVKATTQGTADKLKKEVTSTAQGEIEAKTVPIEIQSVVTTVVTTKSVSNIFRELAGEEVLDTQTKPINLAQIDTTEQSVITAITKDFKTEEEAITKKSKDTITTKPMSENIKTTYYSDDELPYFEESRTTPEPDIIDFESEEKSVNATTKSTEILPDAEETTSKLISLQPMETKSTSPKPTTTKAATQKSTTLKPTVSKLTTSKSVIKATTLKTTTKESTSLKAIATKSTTLKFIQKESTTLKQAETESTTAKSAVLKSTTVNPTTTKSTTLEPGTESTTVTLTTTKSTTLKPEKKSTTLRPTVVKSTTVKPTTLEPEIESTTSEAAVLKSTTLETITTESTTLELAAIKSTTLNPETIFATRDPTTTESTTKSLASKPGIIISTTLKATSLLELNTTESTSAEAIATESMALEKANATVRNLQNNSPIVSTESILLTTLTSDKSTTTEQASQPPTIDPNEVPFVSTSIRPSVPSASTTKTTASSGKPTTTQNGGEMTIQTDGNSIPIKDGLTTICKPDNITVIVNKSVIGEYEKKYGPLHLNAQDNGLCRGVEYDSYYRYTIAPDILDCGTRLELNETHVNFTNTVSNSKYRTTWLRSLADSSGTVIMGHRLKATPMRFIYMKIWCTFPLDLNVSTQYPFLPQLTMQVINFNVSGRGEFSAVMQLYKTNKYKEAYLTPPTIGATDTLFVGVSLLGTEDENTNVVIQRCWATPTRDLDHPEKYPIIKQSCPVTGNLDGSIKVHGNGEDSMVKWEGAVFKFIAHKEVWLHCEIKICFGDNCQPKCNRISRKRRAIGENIILEPKAHILSAGPIVSAQKEQIKASPSIPPESTTNAPEESALMDNTLILIIVGVLSAVIIACIIVIVCVVAHFRRQKAKNKFSKGPDPNVSATIAPYAESSHSIAVSQSAEDYFETRLPKPTTTTFDPEMPCVGYNNPLVPQPSTGANAAYASSEGQALHSSGSSNRAFNPDSNVTNSFEYRSTFQNQQKL